MLMNTEINLLQTKADPLLVISNTSFTFTSIMKRLLIAFFTLLLCQTTQAQTINWQNTIGGSVSDLLNDVKATPDGGYICIGGSTSGVSGDKTEPTQGVVDFWVIKLDATGNIQWQNTIGGSGNDQPEIVIPTADGGYLCGGWSDSPISGDKTEDTLGVNDIWLVKLDGSGTILWQNVIGGNKSDNLYDMKITPDGGYILAAASGSDISGDKTESCQGMTDFWVLKLDGAGNIQWQNTIGGSSNDYLYSVDLTDDGGYILGGVSSSNVSGDKTVPRYDIGYGDMWVVKLDSQGNIQWQQSMGGDETDQITAVIQTDDQGFLCAGDSRSGKTGNKTEASMGDRDFWLVKLDASGQILWQNSIGGIAPDYLKFAVSIPDNQFLAGGLSSSGISGDKTEPNWSGDYWVMLLDGEGNLVWQNTIGGSSVDQATCATFSPDKGLLIGGFSNSGISGDKTEVNVGPGWSDFWLVNLNFKYNIIKGEIFADLNSNNNNDTGEPVVSFHKTTELTSGNFTFSNSEGKYGLAVGDSGSYLIQPDPLPYYNASPSSRIVPFNGLFLTSAQNDFAMQPLGTVNDLCVHITPAAPFRSGFNASYIVDYSNEGNTTLNPTIVFYPDNDLSYLSASLNPVSITNDSIVFTVGSLAPLTSGQLIITLSISQGLPIGTLINSGAMILPVAGDANPNCNLHYWEVLTTGSFDPNDILVNRHIIYDTEMASPPLLEYIIRFQNTGNDTAFFVRLDNYFPSNLDLTTLQIVNSSHSCDIHYQAYDSTLYFHFNNILLPDSNINEPMSHGYVKYRVRPLNSLNTGDTIGNRANIYFDYNAPVATNTAITEIVQFNSIEAVSDIEHFSIYPNPAKETLRITYEIKRTSEVEIQLLNLLGETLNTINQKSDPGQQFSLLPVGHLPKGTYIIQVSIGGKSMFRKLIIM